MWAVRCLMPSALLLLLATASSAQLGGDLQAQILYAYETEDSNGLANLAGTVCSGAAGKRRYSRNATASPETAATHRHERQRRNHAECVRRPGPGP